MKSPPNACEHAFLAWRRLDPALSMGGRLAGCKIQSTSLGKAFHSEGAVSVDPGSAYAGYSTNNMAEEIPRGE